MEEVGERYATVILKAVTNVQQEHATKIKTTLEKLQESIKKFIEIYSKSFRVNFSFVEPNQMPKNSRETIKVDESLLIRICALHRLPLEWKYDEFKISLQIYHGTRPIMEPLQTNYTAVTESGNRHCDLSADYSADYNGGLIENLNQIKCLTFCVEPGRNGSASAA